MTNILSSGYSERFVTVKRLAELPAYKGWLTESSVRHLIFTATRRFNSKGEELPSNGLDKAIIRIGRKVLIDLDEFDRWIDDHRESVVRERGVER